MRTASTAVKPCQEDSSEFYLITGSIYTDQRGTVVFLMVAAARRGRRQSVKVKELQEICIIKAFKLKNQEKYEHVGLKVTSAQDGKDHKLMIKEIFVEVIPLAETKQREKRELKAAELKIQRLENRQRDEALYFSTTDEELKAILRARPFS
ncbi:hypothetical protein Tco_0242231 [Tanacetum coccineum]